MKDFPLIVSFYTKDTLYQLEVQNLIASCEKWGLEHHVEPIASFGAWDRNCSYKPFFLMQMLQKFERPLLWVDADAAFIQRPEPEDFSDSWDFAVRINERCEDTHPSKVISATVFVNRTEGAAKVLRAWGQGCIDSFANQDRREEVWDQIVLRDVVLQGVLGSHIAPLPLRYTAIFDHAGDQEEISNVVIGHYQASRRLKKLVNGQA